MTGYTANIGSLGPYEGTGTTPPGTTTATNTNIFGQILTAATTIFGVLFPAGIGRNNTQTNAGTQPYYPQPTTNAGSSSTILIAIVAIVALLFLAPKRRK